MACAHTTSGAHRGNYAASASHKLEEAREPLCNIQDLKVDPELQEYTGLLPNALESQLAAEAKEIQFYEMLEQDPALSENRNDAQDILADSGTPTRSSSKRAKALYSLKGVGRSGRHGCHVQRHEIFRSSFHRRDRALPSGRRP